MNRGRELVPLPLAPDAAVLSALPALEAALGRQSPPLLPVPAADRAVADRYAEVFSAGTGLAPAEDDARDPTAFVVATSGSTADPKGALLPVSALRASAAATDERLGGPGSWLLALPPWHVAGLQVLLRSLLAGTSPTVLDLTAPFTAEAFVAAAAACTGRRRYVSLVATQLSRVLAAGGAAVEALAGFDAVLVGAAATPPTLQSAAREAGIGIVTTYGMTETCGGCVYDGRPLAGVQVHLDDGRVLLGGEVVARGYSGRPELSASAFDGHRFRTGDLGRVDGDGTLAVLGRADDVIVTGGVNVVPREVEDLLLADPAVAEVAVIGVPDPQWGQRVVAVVVSGAGSPPTLASLRRRVTATSLPALAPRQLVLVPEMPLLGTGKPDRRNLRVLAERDVRARTNPAEDGQAAPYSP